MNISMLTMEGLLNVLISIITLLFLYLIAILLVKRYATLLTKGVGKDPRIQGMVSLFLVLARWTLILFATFMILNELKVDVGPFLAGAGIIGIALSFAAQALLKDIAVGISILMGNYFRIGDVIITNGIQGVVEHMSLMKTIIRDKQTIYYIPNGQIAIVGVVRAHHTKNRSPLR